MRTAGFDEFDPIRFVFVAFRLIFRSVLSNVGRVRHAVNLHSWVTGKTFARTGRPLHEGLPRLYCIRCHLECIQRTTVMFNFHLHGDIRWNLFTIQATGDIKTDRPSSRPGFITTARWVPELKVLGRVTDVRADGKRLRIVNILLDLAVRTFRECGIVLEPILEMVAVLEECVDIVQVLIRLHGLWRAIVESLEPDVVTLHTL